MHRRLVSRHILVLALAAAVLGLVPDQSHAQPTGDFIPVTDAMLAAPSPDNWLMWRRTLNGWGYSPLDQGCSHVVIATFEPLCGKETVEVLGWQKHVFAVCG